MVVQPVQETKTTKQYTLKGYILWQVNYIATNLLYIINMLSLKRIFLVALAGSVGWA